jgi:hypothetical protein
MFQGRAAAFSRFLDPFAHSAADGEKEFAGCANCSWPDTALTKKFTLERVAPAPSF